MIALDLFLERDLRAGKKTHGHVWFSDRGKPTRAMGSELQGVFHVSADLGTMTLLVNDFLTPNGLAFSPDESVLYINDV